jgi:hypothetical protein
MISDLPWMQIVTADQPEGSVFVNCRSEAAGKPGTSPGVQILISSFEARSRGFNASKGARPNSRRWEARECDPAVAEILGDGVGVVMFIHADHIHRPISIAEVTNQTKALNAEVKPVAPIEWHPRVAPTQVQLVDILQMFRAPSLHVGAKKLGIMLSAWDKVEEEQRDPKTFLAENMPLLSQYLEEQSDGWAYKVYGVSAQGGEFEPDSDKPVSEALQAKIDAVRAVNVPSLRIRLVSDTTSHDLTESVSWLME